MSLLTVDLHPRQLRIGGHALPGRLLPALIAALLEAHGEGLASAEHPLDRGALRDRIATLPDVHRTQLWRALRTLADTPLAGLIGHATASAGPFWLETTALARCEVLIEGLAADPARLAAFLRPRHPAASEAPRPLPPLAFVDALSQADHLLDRGELYPARTQLARAQAHVAESDLAERAAIAVRRARIARRLGEWAALRDELRALTQLAADPRLERHQRRLLGARLHILAAWHLYGSLGQVDAALARLEAVAPDSLAGDLQLRNDHLNLRGMLLREQALRTPADAGAPQLAAHAVSCFGEAIRCAALAGHPDPLQVTAANLANTLGRLDEAGLLPSATDHNPDGSLPQALDWLLLSDAICTRWGIATQSLLNLVFLLRLAAVRALPFAALAHRAELRGQPLSASGYCQLAEEAWRARAAVHSQIPTEQRCAFFLVWADHARRERRAIDSADLCRRLTREVRKLRDPVLRRAYAEELTRLQGPDAALPG